MPFNLAAFEKAEFIPRTKSVPVPGLKQFFGKGKPVWIVRGATSEETFRAAEGQAKQLNMASMVTALVDVDTTEADKVESIKKALGVSDKSVPGELSKRIELLAMCSVKPEISLAIAVKVAEAVPVTFVELTNAIFEMTGKGQKTEEKPKPSGRT